MGETLKDRRLKVCDDCSYLEKSRCGICGCLIRLKAAKKSEECPLGKWPSE